MRKAHHGILARAAVLAMAAACTTGFRGSAPAAPPANVGVTRADTSDRDLYAAACAACHGSDGRGAPVAQTGFVEPALPDFTDCAFASREAAQDWYAVAHDGGPVRSFSRRMPAFGDALTAGQLERVVAYVRGFCTDASWPRGELNFPRAMATEKAFPEDEWVLAAGATTRRGTRSGDAALVYERRFGARNQWEVVLPVGVREQADGAISRLLLGDVKLAVKRTLHHDADRGRILSVLGEVALPVGDPDAGMGTGTALFEPALLFAQAIGGSAFGQGQVGLELSANQSRAGHEAFVRGAFGTTLANGFGRAWSPMVELLAARGLERGTTVAWDVIPQVQVSLSRRQHILASIGLRVPVTDRATRPPEFVAYMIWDWFDGGLFEGWR